MSSPKKGEKWGIRREEKWRIRKGWRQAEVEVNFGIAGKKEIIARLYYL